MAITQRIQELMAHHFPDAQIALVDDSAKHAGHAGARAGGESHFTLTVISAAFVGQSRVARHRAVYSVLQPLFDQGLHALAIVAKVPGE